MPWLLDRTNRISQIWHRDDEGVRDIRQRCYKARPVGVHLERSRPKEVLGCAEWLFDYARVLVGAVLAFCVLPSVRVSTHVLHASRL